MRSNAFALVIGIGAASGLLACSSDDSSTPPGSDGGNPAADGSASGDGSVAPVDGGSPNPGTDAGSDAAINAVDASDGASAAPANAVYTMTNGASGNEVIGFTRANDGSLTPMAAPFSTGGKGTGAGLGEQGAVAYDYANDRLYVVNAGDNSFSVLPVNPDGTLGTAINVPASAVSGGAALVGPKSVTFHGNTVYVLFEGNATTASAIAGWTFDGSAATPIASSIVPLSGASFSSDPAQISFSADGSWLVVTEKQSGNGTTVVAGSGSIDTFAVDSNGVATKKGFYPTASAGADAGLQATPFGFSFYGNYLVVSEAGSTGVGTYTYADGVIAPVSGAPQFLPTDPAPCWVAISSDWAYVANAKGPDVSGFTVSATTGGLTAIGTAANAVVAPTGMTVTTDAGVTFEGPTDEALSADGHFFYVLDSAVPAIGVFSVNGDGTLTRVGSADYTAAALPVGVVGIIAR